MTLTLHADKPGINYYWCQTVEFIIISIVVKAKIDKVKVEFGDTFLDVKLKSSPATLYRLQLGLSNPVNPRQCSYTVLSAKLELKLKKCKSIWWDTLEGEIKPKHRSTSDNHNKNQMNSK
ncbi:Suppressor of G2 allele of SKP1 [Homalodisca vitripennis]|nr:Suppressor of G2 allele of SKP1 [Homalodisca vitripennis]